MLRGSSLTYLCAGDAHGNADVSKLQCGRIIDAITGHGHDLAHVFQQPHNVLLVPRLSPRDDGALCADVAAQESCPVLQAELGELQTCKYPISVMDEPCF